MYGYGCTLLMPSSSTRLDHHLFVGYGALPLPHSCVLGCLGAQDEAGNTGSLRSSMPWTDKPVDASKAHRGHPVANRVWRMRIGSLARNKTALSLEMEGLVLPECVF